MKIEKLVERPKSLTAIAKDMIRNAIVDGELPFGSQLSESALALKLGFSKTPVREALLQLKLEGLVEILPQSGTLVFKPTEDQVREICRFREIIELSALELAMRLDADELAQRLTAALKIGREESLDDDSRHRKQDAQFHGAILECCGNAYLQSAYQLVADKIQALRARLAVGDKPVGTCDDMHAEIMRLIRDGNVRKACTELRAHIRSTEDSYIRASKIDGNAGA
ncbi:MULTISPECIES: GntR family transcriptional regulator [unclassified Caballeronia]|uniref:GntR family transcriptional regulator n=1 Tax=unclassified Caballeronia TaxID=2646786 RepID=UPI00202782A1|nr:MULTISPECIES: GntR family transcriptional regulator [unclassified Caballeronia]MDR5794918.1 GntR family transcriptional regulator [Caballeronia sp. LZ008]